MKILATNLKKRGKINISEFLFNLHFTLSLIIHIFNNRVMKQV